MNKKCTYYESCRVDLLRDQTCGCLSYMDQLRQELKELREKIHIGNYQDVEPEIYRIEEELRQYGIINP